MKNSNNNPYKYQNPFNHYDKYQRFLEKQEKDKQTDRRSAQINTFNTIDTFKETINRINREVTFKTVKVDKNLNYMTLDSWDEPFPNIKTIVAGKGIREQIQEEHIIKFAQPVLGNPCGEIPLPKEMKNKEPEYEITYENNPEGYHHKGLNHWHRYRKYKSTKNTSIIISDNLGGCGIQQLYNWSNYNNNNDWDEVIKYILNDLHHGVGIILCQVGKDFYNSKFVKALENNGFESSIEYDNHQHGGDYTGRLYTKLIKK